MGANKLETVKVLLNAGARIDFQTWSGGTVLTGALENEDSDPEVVRLLLEKWKSSSSSNHEFISFVTYRYKSTTLKWKSIHFVAKMLYRVGTSTGGLVRFLALESGTTPLNLAVVRGDIEIVDPYIENDLGTNAFEICDKFGPFPSVLKVLRDNIS